MCCDGPAELVMLGVLGSAAVIALAVLWWLIPRIVEFTRELAADSRRYSLAQKSLDALGEDGAWQVIRAIEQASPDRPRGCIIMRRPDQPARDRFVVRLPTGIPDFPWSGMVVSAERSERSGECPVIFRIGIGTECDEPDQIKPEIFWPPYVRPKGRKGQHIFSATRQLELSEVVRERMSAHYPEAPEKLLEAIHSKYGLDDYAIRVGLSPEWVQGWRTHKCRECRKPLRLIIQLPGDAIQRKLGNGVFYLFGCTVHPDAVVVDEDWY